MLAVYQKSNVIELESKSESSPTEDPEYTAVPKMLASAETKQRHILAIDKLMVLYWFMIKMIIKFRMNA